MDAMVSSSDDSIPWTTLEICHWVAEDANGSANDPGKTIRGTGGDLMDEYYK